MFIKILRGSIAFAFIFVSSIAELSSSQGESQITKKTNRI